MVIKFYLVNPLPLVRMFMSAYTMFAFTTYSCLQTGANPSATTTENSGAPGKQSSISGIKVQVLNFIFQRELANDLRPPKNIKRIVTRKPNLV